MRSELLVSLRNSPRLMHTVSSMEANPIAESSNSIGQQVVQFLSKPSAYADETTNVEVKQTHISWVFLTTEHAFKLKKSLKFEFLDYSTCERRKQACEQECELNRRFAEDVYLGISPITRNETGELALDGSGTVVDWVVKMRRLPDDRSLAWLLEQNALLPEELKRIGHWLTAKYQDMVGLDITPDSYFSHIESHIRANLEDLLGLPDIVEESDVRHAHVAQLRFLAECENLLKRRVREHRIVDGHGDLRPEHIYLLPEPCAIDGVEFSEELRQIDILDELEFLAMECEMLRADTVGRQIVDTYQCATGDAAPRSLLDFYKCYRACVRAKVTALRAAQVEVQQRQTVVETARCYLALANRIADQLSQPWLIIIFGLSGSGKSTLAKALANHFGMLRLASDDLRDRPTDGRKLSYGEGAYSESNRRAVYEVMFDRARDLLRSGVSVLLDATFMHAELRRDAATLATHEHADFTAVHCHCPLEERKSRIADRTLHEQTTSDARSDFCEQQAIEFEADPDELVVCHIDTHQPPAACLSQLLDQLKSQM